MPRYQGDKPDMLLATMSVAAALLVIAIWWFGYFPPLNIAIEWLAYAAN